MARSAQDRDPSKERLALENRNDPPRTSYTGIGGLMGMAMRASVGLWDHSRTLDSTDPAKAARIRRAITASWVWALIMLGALALFAAAVIQLVLDY